MLNDRQPDDANAQQLGAYLARMKSVFVGCLTWHFENVSLPGNTAFLFGGTSVLS